MSSLEITPSMYCSMGSVAMTSILPLPPEPPPSSERCLRTTPEAYWCAVHTDEAALAVGHGDLDVGAVAEDGAATVEVGELDAADAGAGLDGGVEGLGSAAEAAGDESRGGVGGADVGDIDAVADADADVGLDAEGLDVGDVAAPAATGFAAGQGEERGEHGNGKDPSESGKDAIERTTS
jgi:hypothetical protein